MNIIKCNECDRFFYVDNVSDIEYFASCFHHKGFKEIHMSLCALRLDADRRELLKALLEQHVTNGEPMQDVACELLAELERGE